MKQLCLYALMMSVLLSGCGGLYTVHSYGPSGDTGGIAAGTPVDEVFKKLGGPDYMGELKDGSHVLVFNKHTGIGILGIYTADAKTQMVVVTEGGKVKSSATVTKGVGLAIFGGIGPHTVGRSDTH